MLLTPVDALSHASAHERKCFIQMACKLLTPITVYWSNLPGPFAQFMLPHQRPGLRSVPVFLALIPARWTISSKISYPKKTRSGEATHFPSKHPAYKKGALRKEDTHRPIVSYRITCSCVFACIRVSVHLCVLVCFCVPP